MDETEGLAVLSELADAWTEIEPSDHIRKIRRRLLQNYPLRATDSLQLAAALVWTDKTPKGRHFLCLDAKLREAAVKEGLRYFPRK